MSRNQHGDLAERAWQDRHRPRFHFVAPAAWLNDPNGLSQWDGRYHLFYQYNPDAPTHSNIHWGHASSADLVHWTDEPIALEPSEGPDENGCWSGVLVDDDGIPTLVYSGHKDGVGQRACIAVGDADLRTWRKDPDNPMIADPPEGLPLTEFRDHCVWREDGEWRQLVGSGIRGAGGTALLYRSKDLRSWDFVGPLVVGDVDDTSRVWTGSTWECVDMFRLGDETQPAPDVLMFSVWNDGVTHYPAYYTGRYEGDRFEPSDRHHLDYGLRYFYAPQSMRDESGRRILFGWMQEGRPDAAAVAAGWSGVMSLPREATMTADGRLLQAPVAEIDRLRRDKRSVGTTTLRSGESVWLDDVAGDQLDLEATVLLAHGSILELAVRATADGVEQTRIVLDASDPGSPDHVVLALDRTSSSLDAQVDAAELAGVVAIGADRRVSLRVLIDHSAIEIFLDGRPLATRIYPTRTDALGVALSSRSGPVEIEEFHAWTMADIWDGPRPLRP